MKNYYSWLLSCRTRTAMDSDFNEKDHPRTAGGGEHGGEFAIKPETLAKEDSRDKLSRGETHGESGRFQVGGVHDVWSKCPYPELYNRWQIVEVSDDRKSALVYNMDYASSDEDVAAIRVPIQNDPRFGEKIVMYNSGWPFVIRADKMLRKDEMPRYYDADARRRAENKAAGVRAARKTRKFNDFARQMIEKCDTVEKFSRVFADVKRLSEPERKEACKYWNEHDARVMPDAATVGKEYIQLVLIWNEGGTNRDIGVEIPISSDYEKMLGLVS